METTSFQMWNNAAYDDHSIPHSCKENHSSPTPLLPLKPLPHNPISIDSEMDDIQRQISHLTSRLNSLRLQKTHWFSNPSPTTPFNTCGKVKATTPFVKKNQRRSFSMGPSEIAMEAPRKESSTACNSHRSVKQSTRASPCVGRSERKTGWKGGIRKGGEGGRIIGKKMEEGRRKRRWEIPRELILHRSEEVGGEWMASLEEEVVLPRIRTSRCMFPSPRDSGAAKRVAELEGKNTFFSILKDGGEEDCLVCQSLDFGEEQIVYPFV